MSSTEPAKIMIIGVDSHFCYLIRSYIRRCDHDPLFTPPDENVLQVAQREKPTVIVMDLDLPGLGGWNLLRSLKSSQDTREIPVVICSWIDERERGIKEGANVYLRMPILYSDFLKALKDVGILTNLNAG